MRTHLELNDKDDAGRNQYQVSPLAHTWNRKFECNPTVQPIELATNDIDLAQPSVALHCIQRERISFREMSQDFFGRLIDCVRDRARIECRCRDLYFGVIQRL